MKNRLKLRISWLKWRAAFGTHTASLLVSQGKCPVLLAVELHIWVEGTVFHLTDVNVDSEEP